MLLLQNPLGQPASFQVESCPIVLTIRVQLVRVKGQSAVVLFIGDSIIIIIMVAGVSLAIFVMVSLVGVRDVWAVVQIVLVSVLINILIAVTLVSHTVII